MSIDNTFSDFEVVEFSKTKVAKITGKFSESFMLLVLFSLD